MAFSTISDMQNSTSLDGLLKDVYLPGLTQTVFNDPAFTALIQQLTPEDIDFEGQRVIHAFETQRAAGVGAIAEGGSFVTSQPVKGKQGSETLKYLNAYIELSGPLIATAKSQRGSFVNAVSRHFSSNIVSAKNDLERQIMGKGDGEICDVSDATPTGATLSVIGDAFFDTQFCEPGMMIEFRNSGSNYALRAAIDGTNAYTTITSVTKGSKQGTDTRGTITVSPSITGVVTDGDRIVRYGAYPTTPGSNWYEDIREINGLRNLVSDATNNSETTGNYDYIWGIDRSATGYEYLQSYMQDFGSTPLDEETILTGLIMLTSQYQGNPNLLVCSPRAMKDYFFETADALRQFNTNTAMTWVGGYKGVGVQLGSKQLMLTSLASVPEGYIYMINTNDFAFTTATNGYQWVLGDGQNVLQQHHTKDTKFASALNYINFVCFNPGAQYKGYGITETG
jgi:hypothetical protein